MSTTQTISATASVARPAVGPWWRLGKYLLAAWVAASLLFAHGCHGDEDHELFTSFLASR